MAVNALASDRGSVWMAQAFLLSLIVPMHIPIGSLLLMPHRLFLLVLFIPLFAQLFFLGRAGRLLLIDWLMLGCAVWSAMAMFFSSPSVSTIEAIGIFVIEFLGAYMLARVAVRSSADMYRVMWTLFLIIGILLPFAIAESVTGRAIFLELVPGPGIRPVAPDPRWGLRRAQAAFAHPILYGVFVSAGAGFFWYMLRPKWMRLPGAGMAAIATFFSLSAGALASVVVQGIFAGWELVLRAIRVRWRLFMVLAVLGYITIDLLSNRTPFHVIVTYLTFYQGSSYGRIIIWNFGIQNVWANPLFGLGVNIESWSRPVWLGGSVDNYWLMVAMRFGIPAFLMYAGAIFYLVFKVSRTALTDPDDKASRAAYLTVIGGLVVAGGTVHYWHALEAYFLFLLGAGLWTISGGARRVEDPDTPQAVEPERRSRYTRQRAPGVSIGGRRQTGGAQPSAVRRKAVSERTLR